jgi:hypothetical protein
MPPGFCHYIGHLHEYLDSKHCNKEDSMLSDRHIPPNPRYREACFLDTFIIWCLRHETLQTWRAIINFLAKNNMMDAHTWKAETTKLTDLGSYIMFGTGHHITCNFCFGNILECKIQTQQTCENLPQLLVWWQKKKCYWRYTYSIWYQKRTYTLLIKYNMQLKKYIQIQYKTFTLYPTNLMHTAFVLQL